VTTAALTCKELVEIVTDYVEGALSPADARRLEHHLAGCRGCAAYLDQMRETIRLTGTLAEEHIEPGARDALRAAFRGWRRGGG
jgi:anti-sigma factor RsiW